MKIKISVEGVNSLENNPSIVEKSKIKVKKPKHYKVIMHNDDYTTMEFVVYILIEVFNKSLKDANRIMMEVHEKGRGIAGIYPYDIAVSKTAIAMDAAEKEGYPFKLTVEEE
ncbi:MAG TPA: ATP-dependent Clp protease adaptor ClpS [Clostridium sp.]|jgi:ATP-dependent Clp protease adaptor protein ClpS|nr:ATP-dependent Clp protease adaptor ClpS [Clostridia bacterium]HCW04029.1 ATP-dependent Clp protease adaptor ClpS [Clostridium sp.]